MSQLLNPPKPPQRKKRPGKLEFIGQTGYAIRILENKDGMLVHVDIDGETPLAHIRDDELDSFIYGISRDYGSLR